MGLGVGLQVDVGLGGLLNTAGAGAGAGAALWAALPLLLLSARSRLKHEMIRKCHISLTEFIFDRSQLKRELSLETRVQLFDKPFLQSKASLVAALAFHWVSRWDSRSVICHVSVSVFAPEVRLT